MKKVYSALMAVLLSLVALQANAFYINVHVDTPDNLTKLTLGGVALDMTQPFPQSVELSDDASRYLYIYIKQGCYMTSCIITDENGNELSASQRGVKKGTQFVNVPVTADYGDIYITTTDRLENDATMRVNVEGDPSKVSLMVYGNGMRTVDLKEGANDVSYMSTMERTFYVMPRGVTQLYKVTLNDAEVKPYGASSEDGTITYQYNVTPVDGGVLTIVTDFPDIYHACPITLGEGMEGFLTSVTINGQSVAQTLSQLSVHVGDVLSLRGNTDDYEVTSFLVNGQEHHFTAGEWGTVVLEDMTIHIEGYLIPRPLTVYTRTYGWNNVADGKQFYGYRFSRADGRSVVLPEGESTFAFAENENPFVLFVGCEVEGTVRVFINDEQQTDQYGNFSLTFKDGDVLTIALGNAVIPNGIDRLDAERGCDDFYTLQGVRLPQGAKLPAGLYITRGKKFCVK